MAASKNPRARLLHIRDEIDGVAAIIKGLSFEQYQGSYLHRRAVERAAQIVSEAAGAPPRELLERHGDGCSMEIDHWHRKRTASRVPAP
jgi:uncharacterized protein with HEPN domain